MNFDQIQSFYLAATLGTYQKAAERLNATQPAISARIAALEDRLNIKLFDRSGHRVALTPNGRKFLSHAERLLEIRSQAILDIGQTGELSGVVRIGASDTMVTSWLPDYLLFLREEFPNITVEMLVRSSPLLREDLLNDQVDIGFLIGPISNPTIINHPLCECEMCIVASPSLGLHGRKLSISDLSGISILTFEKLTKPYQELKKKLRYHEMLAHLNPISALSSIMILTEKGLGVGAVPLLSVEKEVANGSLVLLEFPFTLETLTFTISYLDGPNRAVVELITQSAATFLKSHSHLYNIKMSY